LPIRRSSEEARLPAGLFCILEFYADFLDASRGKSKRKSELTDELIVPMGGLKVAIRLPLELQSADRLKFDFSDNSFVVVDN
jgi:hypothetical protein